MRLRRTRTGLHAVGDLLEAEATRAFEEAAAGGVEATPLGAYFYGEAPRPPDALVLGFGSVRPSSIDDGVRRLGSALDAARRPGTGRMAADASGPAARSRLPS